MTLSSLRTSRTARRVLAIGAPIVISVLVAIAYEVLDGMSGTGGHGSGSVAAASVSGKDVSAQLSRLVVAPEAPMTGYSREEFPHWDTDKPEHGFGDQFAQ